MNKLISKTATFSLLLALSAFFFLFTSCGRKWKQTTKAEYSFSINKATTPGRLHFTGGTMRMNAISFTGTRKRGGDVNFSNSPGAVIDFGNNTVTPSISYDIPQGTYTNITMQFRSDATDTANPSITLIGKFDHSPNDTTPVYFQFEASQIFSVQATSAGGSREITLSQDHSVKALVTFDPVYWFEIIPPGQLQSATHVPVNSVSSIVINTSINSDLYQLVADRIREGTTVVFQ